jgi:hypothetical protein
MNCGLLTLRRTMQIVFEVPEKDCDYTVAFVPTRPRIGYAMVEPGTITPTGFTAVMSNPADCFEWMVLR